MHLRSCLSYSLRPTGPMPDVDGASGMTRQFWQMDDAELKGDGWIATAPYAGIDWMTVGADGWNRPEVKVSFLTDKNETILLLYTGLVKPTPVFNRAAETQGTTQWDDQIMRMTMTFDTGAERLRWLTQSLFVARGRLDAGRIVYEIFEVS